MTEDEQAIYSLQKTISEGNTSIREAMLWLAPFGWEGQDLYSTLLSAHDSMVIASQELAELRAKLNENEED